MLTKSFSESILSSVILKWLKAEWLCIWEIKIYPQCYWVGSWIGEMCDVWLMDFSSTFSVYFVGALSHRDAAEQTGFHPPNHLSSYLSQDTGISPRTSLKNKGALLFWATSPETLMRWTREHFWKNYLRYYYIQLLQPFSTAEHISASPEAGRSSRSCSRAMQHTKQLRIERN